MKHTLIPYEMDKVARLLYSGLATATSLQALKYLNSRDWDSLSMMKVDPTQYTSAESYFYDAQAVSFLRKCESLPTSFDRKKVAIENFFKSEAECYRTNERLSPYLPKWGNPLGDKVVNDVISLARKKIGSVLGKLNLEHIHNNARFGPGSTYGDRGHLATIPDKMSSTPLSTPDAIPFLFDWIGTMWARACTSSGRSLNFVRGNRFTAVPKDCAKHRGICIEPSVNLFYQLGLGSVLKKKLSYAGLDLLHAQDIHRRVAREASISGHLATIDLSNASDTICKNLVELLLPADWFEVFADLRSPTTSIEGKTVRLEKFSSMGNGYTFELETLIFASIAHAVLELKGRSPVWGFDLLVFGDDIIVPSDAAPDVIAALRFFGFTTNKDKTFISGPFRESCGGDYFMGVDVRPYFLKDFPNEPQDYIAMANGLRRVADPVAFHHGRFDHLRRVWFCILDALPNNIRRCRGPQELGDIVIHDVKEFWSSRWENCIRYITVYRPCRWRVVSWSHFRPDVVLASAVLRVGSGREGVTPRDAVLGFKFDEVPFS